MRRIALWPRKTGRSAMAKSMHQRGYSCDISFKSVKEAKCTFDFLRKLFSTHIATPPEHEQKEIIQAQHIFNNTISDEVPIGYAMHDAGPGEQVIVTMSDRSAAYFVADSKGLKVGDMVCVTGVGTVGRRTKLPETRPAMRTVQIVDTPDVELVQTPDHVTARQERERLESELMNAMALPATIVETERTVAPMASYVAQMEIVAGEIRRMASSMRAAAFQQELLGESLDYMVIDEAAESISDEQLDAFRHEFIYSLEEWSLMKHPNAIRNRKACDADPVSSISNLLAYFMCRNVKYENGELEKKSAGAKRRHDRTVMRSWRDHREREVVVDMQMRFTWQEIYAIMQRHPDPKLMQLFEPILKKMMDEDPTNFIQKDIVLDMPDRKRTVKIWTPKDGA